MFRETSCLDKRRNDVEEVIDQRQYQNRSSSVVGYHQSILRNGLEEAGGREIPRAPPPLHWLMGLNFTSPDSPRTGSTPRRSKIGKTKALSGESFGGKIP